MPIDQQTVERFRNAASKAFQDLQEAFQEVNTLYSGRFIENQDGTFSLQISPAQVDALKQRLTILGTELKSIGDKILAAVA